MELESMLQESTGAPLLLRFVAIVGGSIGAEPFGRRTWSGSARMFLTALQKRGVLQRAIGLDVPFVKRQMLRIRNFDVRPNRWKKRYYSDPAYRMAMTAALRKRLLPSDRGSDLLQIGAFYSTPAIAPPGSRCFSYSDANLIESTSSKFAVRQSLLTPAEFDRAYEYEKNLYHAMTLMFTMSEYVRQSFIKNFDVPPERIVAIGGGVNFDTFPEPPRGKNYDSKEVLFVGIEFARKGGWQLLDAFRIVRETHPTAVLHIVGPRTLTIPPAVSGGVVFHGFLDRSTPEGAQKFLDLVQRASLFVMPSLYEPYGLANLEALAYGLPSVVTNAWALKETTIPGETGELVECGNVEHLAATLTRLLRDPEALRAMGEKGVSVVRERYTWDRVVDRLIAALTQPGA